MITGLPADRGKPRPARAYTACMGEHEVEEGPGGEVVDPAGRSDKKSKLPWILAGCGCLVLVGVAALGIFATMLVPQVAEKLVAAQVSVVKVDLIAIQSAIDSFAIQNGGRHPDSLEVLVRPDETGAKYLDEVGVPVDPWGHEYRYDPPAGDKPFRVYTLGADGVPGGEGADRDIDHQMVMDGDV